MVDRLAGDGCTGWLDGWGGLSWRICCDVHDTQFLMGASWADFIQANAELFQCVMSRDIFAATLMFPVVMTVGAFFFWFGAKGKKK